MSFFSSILTFIILTYGQINMDDPDEPDDVASSLG